MKATLARTLGALSLAIVLATVAFFDASHVPPLEAPVLAAPTATPQAIHGFYFDQYGNMFTASECEYQGVAPMLTDGQTSILQCDQNGNVLTSGQNSFTGTLSAGTAQYGRLDAAIPHYSGTALQTGCTNPCVYTVTVAGLNVFYSIVNLSGAMTGTLNVTCYDGPPSTGTVILYQDQLGSNQIWAPAGSNGIKITSGTVSCALPTGTVMVGSLQINTNI